MSLASRLILLSAFGAGLPFAARAAAPAAPQFSGPEVAKIDWNTRALTAADLDGDGRVDLVLINNDRAAIELLYQRDPAAPLPAKPISPSAVAPSRWEPVLEDARFRRETIIVGQSLFDLVVADFNGDGRPDLAATGDSTPLVVRYAQADGTWEEKAYATSPAPVKFLGCLATADLDGDGRSDLVVLGQKELAIFLQKPGVGLLLDEKITLADDNAYGLLLHDLNGDGRMDLCYLIGGQREALRVRYQVAPGKFGPELAFGLKTPRSPLVPVLGELDSPAPKTARAGVGRSGSKVSVVRKTAATPGPLLASALGGGGQVEFSRVCASAENDPWQGLAPRSFAPLAGARSAALYATGDFNRDGASDLAVAFPETAQVFLYLRQPDGGFTVPRRIPSLTDVRALSSGALPGAKAGDQLYVLSGKENTLAEIVIEADGSARPPRALAIPGRLIAFAAGDLGGERRAGLAVVAEEDGKRQLTLWTRAADGAPRRGASVTLAGLRTDPRAVFLHDLDQDGRADVLVAAPSVGLRAYLQKADGSLADAADNPLYRPGLLARADAANAPFAADDVDGDGKPELLVSAENFIRALRLTPEGELVTVAQFDARDPGAEITTGFVLPPSAGAKDEPFRVILHDRKNNQLHLLARASGAGAFESIDLRSVARIEVAGALRLAGPKGRRELLLLGKDRFWWMPEGASDFAIKTEATYASDLPDVRYSYVSGGDIDGDGRTELVAVDINDHTVELLGRDSDGAWTSRLHFKVFETDPHIDRARGAGQEPREAILADVTGDGKADLVLLVHDRVLVYPQE